VVINEWRPDYAGGRIQWCWLRLGADAIALYHDFMARGVSAQRPFVGNGLWVTSVRDPNGYRLDFESPTDVPEDTVYVS
jgi:hypothetical protein